MYNILLPIHNESKKCLNTTKSLNLKFCLCFKIIFVIYFMSLFNDLKLYSTLHVGDKMTTNVQTHAITGFEIASNDLNCLKISF